jgi:4-amino-4-deoxy-L-arabinose transferase-like glycosyltransferase
MTISLHRILFVLILLSGIALRLPYLLTPHHFDSDQAVMGLMAKHILEGEFPVFYWGENYCGPVESYLASLLFYLFGISTFTLGLSPLLFSIGFMMITYKFAREIAGEKGGLIALLLVSIAPPFLIWHSVLARGNYIENLTLGSLILLVTYRIIYKDNKIYLYPILGFLSGLAWYISPQAIHYILISGIFLFLKDRKIFFKRRFFIIILFFFLGSLPFWIYNVLNGWPSFSDIITRHTHRPEYGILIRLWSFFKDMLQSLLGAPVFELKTVFNPSLNLLITLIFCLTLIYLIVERRRALISILKLSLNETKGIDILILLFFLASSVVILFFSDRTTTRFYLPLYSAIPILIAYSVVKMMEKSRVIGILILSLFLFSNLYGVLSNSMVLRPEALEAYNEERKKEKEVIELCKAKGLRYIYTPEFWVAFKLTFYAKEEVIFAMPQREYYVRGYPVNKYPAYTDLADQSSRFGYLLHDRMVITGGFTASTFEENLRPIGGSFKKEVIGPYALFYDFEPELIKVKAIEPYRWRAFSNHNLQDVGNAFDRNIFTRWNTIRHPEGAFFEIDMGGLYKVSWVSILTGPFPQDIPSGYSVEVSKDGRVWHSKAEVRSSLPISWRKGRLVYRYLGLIMRPLLEPEEARYLKIFLKGDEKIAYDWSIAEIFLYEDSDSSIKGPSIKRYGESFKDSLREMEDNPHSEQGYINFTLLNKRLGLKGWPEVGLYLTEELKDPEYGWRILMDYPRETSYPLTRLKEEYQRQGKDDKARIIEERFKKEFTPSEKTDINFGGEIVFIGYNVDKKELSAGDSFQITYYWKVTGKIKRDWTAFVHFLRPDGEIAFQNDHPLYSGYNYSRDWVKGEVYKERFLVEIPEDAMPGNYRIVIGLWDPKTGKRLKVKEGLFKGREEATIGELRIIG